MHKCRRDVIPRRGKIADSRAPPRFTKPSPWTPLEHPVRTLGDEIKQSAFQSPVARPGATQAHETAAESRKKRQPAHAPGGCRPPELAVRALRETVPVLSWVQRPAHHPRFMAVGVVPGSMRLRTSPR